ncbi:MAG: hypothetical protein MJZ66_05485 [Bacteroidales bacterium]|nr:hypothetical protein [Bacteroidales bacterium]
MKNFFLSLSLALIVPFAVSAQDSTDVWKFRFGGYGEMLAQFKDYGTNRFYGGADGNPKVDRASVSIPRFVLAFDYNFNQKWQLGAEIEFESGGVGSAMELENSENGEYETEIEKGGEVAIEQFHITRKFLREINLRFGHIIVPVGLTNSHHEPINFFGTTRPEGETTILPSTWHENGVEIFGSVGRNFAKFDYQFQVIEGLNANGFDRNKWVAGGKQGIFEEDNFTCPAIVGRLDYKGVPGLRIGASYYYLADAGKNADKYQTYSSCGKATVKIITADVQYKNKFVTFRGNILDGNLDNSSDISKKNIKLSNKSPYSRLTPIASKAVSYGCEAGLNVKPFFQSGKFPDLVPFVRYEYYNPQEKGESDQVMDPRLKVSMLVGGINYYILPNLVAKFDYTSRKIGGGKYNSENEFAFGLAYIGWFVRK